MVVVPDIGFPDVELTLMAYLEQATGLSTDTESPPDGEAGISVNMVGGQDDLYTDYSRVEVSSYGATRNTARSTAERVRQLLLVLGGQNVEVGDGTYVYVDFCRTDVPPESLPYDNPDRRRVAAFYQLGLRRPRGRSAPVSTP